MPFAISIRYLCDLITERLNKKYTNPAPPIPSVEWIRLQFWPSNPYSNKALQYTGHFEVKYGVQVSRLHKSHPDSHYVGALLQYVRCFSVKYHDHMLLVSVDDKSIIPVGEPSCPVSTGVHGHNRSLVPLNGPHLQALDHDFHVHGIVLSVAFVINVPMMETDSFYSGQAFVTNKDKVAQPSNAFRHATEVTNLIKSLHSPTQPIVL